MLYVITLVSTFGSVVWSVFSPLWAWCPLVALALYLLGNVLVLKFHKSWRYAEQRLPSTNEILQTYGHFYSMPLSSHEFNRAASVVQRAGALVAIIGATEISWRFGTIAVVWWLILDTIAAFYAPTILFKTSNPKAIHEKAIAWTTKGKGEHPVVRMLQGDAESQFAIGGSYFERADSAHDYMEAVKWFKKAAQRGNVSAQFCLGACYDGGLGIPQNYGEAAKWYRMAAEQGHDEAQFMLGFHHIHGHGVPQDYAKGAKWYWMAAELGNWRAQFDLSLLYANQQTPQSQFAAYTWLSLAETWSEGERVNDIAEMKQYLIERMSPDLITKAECWARDWRPSTWDEIGSA